MTPEFVVQILRDTLMTTLWLAAPLLIIGFLAGIVISLIQIVTSIQDSGFSTIPRLVAFLFGTILLMPWMLRRVTDYTILLFSDLGRYAR
ncbi:MAG TPA: flagellar biosynthetic protein FliQ [Bryobacteraceae bacterium]|jgi:flagellar biosynthetic protein FliQ|nr:flagellar biosynthetic protein FliQ [Bryobacteraceae bacterium]